MGQEEARKLLKERKMLCRKDLQEYFDIPYQHAQRIFVGLKKYEDTISISKIVSNEFTNRKYVVEYVKFK